MPKTIIWVSLILLAIVAVALFAGPRVAVDTSLQALQLPDDLDAYLRQVEAQFDDIVPGAEKTIVWAAEPGQKTPLPIVYLHGFSASSQETAPLAEASVNDWLNDAHEALQIGRRLGEEVIVIGTFTGGTAAAWLAAETDTENVRAFVLISPNFAPRNRQSEILTWIW